MFNKILLATTASPTCDDAAKVAFALAGKYHADFYIFHVFGIPSRGAGLFVTDVRTGLEETVDEDYIAWVKEEIKTTYASRLEGMNHACIDCTAGSPATEILRKARKENVDLIVMGAHTRQEDVGSYRHRQIAGSTMQRVARGARCPVLIVSRPCNTCFAYSTIVFGTDFSKAAMAAFKFARHTAKRIGSKLYLFHAVDLSEMRFGQTAGQEYIEQRIADARQKIEKVYLPHMKTFDDYEIVVWEGIPHVEILKFAREKSAELIVLAHHTCDADPEKALMGSTVEQVVLRSACPVVSVNQQDKVEWTDEPAMRRRSEEAIR